MPRHKPTHTTTPPSPAATSQAITHPRQQHPTTTAWVEMREKQGGDESNGPKRRISRRLGHS